MKNVYLNTGAILLLILLGIASCSQNQVLETSSEVGLEAEEYTDKEMIAAGYTKGTVKEMQGMGTPCDFQILLEDTRMIESLEFPEGYKSDGMDVWVKFSMQRRPQQCSDAQPVEIIEIKKREG